MTKLDKKFIIAIDGAAATGKSVLAKQLAKELNILYIDTGAMYRTVGYFFVSNDIVINKENIEKNLKNIDISLKYINGESLVYLNGKDVSQEIRTEKVSMAASDVSKFKLVREKLVDMQRKMSQGQSVVLEGRDISTVVFPNADLKIFLTASIDVRASRRKLDLEKKGEFLEINEIKKSLEKRDLQDSTRLESPLIKSKDAIEIDTTNLTNDKTVMKVIDLLRERI